MYVLIKSSFLNTEVRSSFLFLFFFVCYARLLRNYGKRKTHSFFLFEILVINIFLESLNVYAHQVSPSLVVN